MSEENLGAGPYLDKSFDFDIDGTGDIRASEGLSELEKDLALYMAVELEDFLGRPPTPETSAEVKRAVYRTAIADVRISSVERESISVEWNNRNKKLVVSIPVTTTANEEYELVFDV